MSILDLALWRVILPDRFELEAGKHHLAVRLAFTSDATEGELLLPLVVVRRGQGPSVLVVGGTHGDEFEGQVVVSVLCREIGSYGVNGTLFLLPQHNVVACHAGTRLTSGSGDDLNRVYGTAHGTGPAHAIARFAENMLIPRVDWVIDLHSGGMAHEFVLSSNLQASRSAVREMVEPLLAFDAPYAIVFDEVPTSGHMPHAGTLEGFARSLGKKAISSELGGGGRITPASRAVANHGLRSLLTHIGVADFSGAVRPQQSRSRLLFLGRPEHYAACKTGGRFVPQVWLGDEVRSCELLAFIGPHDALAAPHPIRSSSSCVVAAVAV